MQLLTTREVHTRLGVGHTTFHHMLRRGEFPPPDLRRPGKNLWVDATVDEWIRDQVEIDRRRRMK